MSDFLTFLNGGQYLQARSGTPKSAVLILHGYGADGHNLIDLGRVWSQKMPDTVFIAPNAFEHCEMGMGYQWFSLMDRSVDVMHRHIQTIQTQWNQGVQSLLDHFDLIESDIALVGFSQGSMLSLYQGVYGPYHFKGIVGYSGGFAPDEKQIPHHTPPILICHGLDDDVVPADFSESGHKALTDMGSASQLHLYPRTGHEINEDGFMAGGAFLKELLY